MDELLAQSEVYFKQEGFKRLFHGMRTKYESLGHLGGTIQLKNLSDIEKQALNGFLRVDLTHKESISITVLKVRKLLLDTKFVDIDLEAIFFQYFKDIVLITNTEKQRTYRDEQLAFLKELFTPFTGTIAIGWITTIFNDSDSLNQTLARRYEADKEKLKEQLPLVLKALNHLPKFEMMKKRLPIFASEITGNPHAFDENGSLYPLLIQGICFIVDVPYYTGMDAEARMNVLYEAGIIKDDISSFTITYALYAYNHAQEVLGWREFACQKEPLLISLSNLYDVTSIHAEEFVFAVENPSVFSALLEFCKEESISNISLLCTYGQLRVASIQTLDLLVQNGHHFYYAGDFDPEGLQIAQKLSLRYKEACILWRYDVCDYQASLSSEALGEARLRKLESLHIEALNPIKRCLQEHNIIGYQEQLLDKYKEDILLFTKYEE